MHAFNTQVQFKTNNASRKIITIIILTQTESWNLRDQSLFKSEGGGDGRPSFFLGRTFVALKDQKEVKGAGSSLLKGKTFH